MYWRQKIELVKKKFPPENFKDPFRSGDEIITKIVTKLFESTWLNFIKSDNRAALLKQGMLMKRCTVKQFYKEELPHLAKDRNFWLLLINLPTGSGLQVYDCKYEPLRELLYMASGQMEQEFCIADKKYAGLLFYKIDITNDLVEIYKGGNINTLIRNQVYIQLRK